MAESNRDVLELFFQALDRRDWDAVGQLVDVDYLWDMPQSGERVRGVANNREMNENYPGLPKVEPQRITGSEHRWVTTPSWTLLKITGSGDDYTSESVVTYPDGSVWRSVDIFRFRGGKILSQTAYFAATLEPAEWRARWVERP